MAMLPMSSGATSRAVSDSLSCEVGVAAAACCGVFSSAVWLAIIIGAKDTFATLFIL